MEILYSHEDLTRVTKIKRYVDGVNDDIIRDHANYDTESLLTQFDYGNDLQATFTYDSRDRLSTLDIKNGSTSYLDLDYTYDINSNVTQLANGWRDTDSNWHSETESYSYDGLDRLISAYCTSWSHTYTYDRAGNRLSKDSVTSTINTVNEVTALSDGTSFTYDSNGNRTQKTKGTGTWVYTYNNKNRLTGIEKNQSTIGEYVYDGDGKRIQVTEDSETTIYVYGHLNVLYEENTHGTASYIYGPKGRFAKRASVDQQGSTYYYHTDQLGSTRLVTDSNKNVVSATTYHPYGETSVEEGTEGYSFTGKEQDSTGLHYFTGRYYDSDLGRFLTRDPKLGYINCPQTLNRYTYVLNNPLSNVDRNGHECVSILREDRSDEPAPFTKSHVGMPLTTDDIVTIFFMIISAIILMSCVITFAFGSGALAIALAEIFTVLSSLNLVWQFIQLIKKLDRDFQEFWECMDEWLAENDYTTKDIVSAEAVDDDTFIVTLDDGTVVNIKRTPTGFEVEEDEESNNGDNGDGSGNDDGGSNNPLSSTPLSGSSNGAPVPI